VRADRKHQSSGVFVASGKRLLMSKQATAMGANVTNRTPEIPSVPPVSNPPSGGFFYGQTLTQGIARKKSKAAAPFV
jgi:hypothetical protein